MGLNGGLSPSGKATDFDSVTRGFESRQPIVAVTDTNCDPDVIDYIIPGNDDAIRAIKLFVTAFSEACQEGEAQMKDGAAVEANAEEAMQKAAETEAAAE